MKDGSLSGLTPKQKKDIVLNQIANGSTQGYWSLMANLELAIWNAKYGSK